MCVVNSARVADGKSEKEREKRVGKAESIAEREREMHSERGS